jgi:hypothetical protein
MIGNVGSASQALQGFQATRSFQNAGNTGSVFRQALLQEIDELEQQQAPQQFHEEAQVAPPDYSQQWTPEAPASPTRMQRQRIEPNPMTQLQPLIQDVLQVAEHTGFIGISSQDVVRAYQSGQSLLADYKV